MAEKMSFFHSFLPRRGLHAYIHIHPPFTNQPSFGRSVVVVIVPCYLFFSPDFNLTTFAISGGKEKGPTLIFTAAAN